jgi:hypothetical protein
MVNINIAESGTAQNPETGNRLLEKGPELQYVNCAKHKPRD